MVIAKAPQPGRSKTRLCPPLTFDEAAGLARAALHDTLKTITTMPNTHRVLVLEGESNVWQRPGWDVVSQRGDGLDERIAAAFAPMRGPTLLVGMDTPQLSLSLLEDALDRLARRSADAVIGPAEDGGYWAVGLRRPQAHRIDRLFHTVPMSTRRTFAEQWSRLRSLGLRVSALPELRDVDDFDDAVVVAEEAPASRFACELRKLMAAHEMAVVE
jgi:uncharacterized protein